MIQHSTIDNACVWTTTGNFSSFTRSQSQTEDDDTTGKQSSQGSVLHGEPIVRLLLLSGPIACRPVMQAQLEKRQVQQGRGQAAVVDGWSVHGGSCRLCFAYYPVMTDTASHRPPLDLSSRQMSLVLYLCQSRASFATISFSSLPF